MSSSGRIEVYKTESIVFRGFFLDELDSLARVHTAEKSVFLLAVTNHLQVNRFQQLFKALCDQAV